MRTREGSRSRSNGPLGDSVLLIPETQSFASLEVLGTTGSAFSPGDPASVTSHCTLQLSPGNFRLIVSGDHQAGRTMITLLEEIDPDQQEVVGCRHMGGHLWTSLSYLGASWFSLVCV